MKRQKPKTKARVMPHKNPLSVRYAELLKLRQAVLKALSEKKHAHRRRRAN